MSVRLSAEEAWAVLEQAHTGILTTLRRDGSPVTLPVWFVPVDHTICFATPAQTKKTARIRNDPRASFLVESGQHWVDLKAVHLSGAVEPVEDEVARDAIEAALSAKYAAFRVASSDMSEATRTHYSARSVFRLVPAGRILTWDNSRLASPGAA